MAICKSANIGVRRAAPRCFRRPKPREGAASHWLWHCALRECAAASAVLETSFRRGMTLVELLVVLTIIMVVAATTGPAAAADHEPRRSARRPARSSSISARLATRPWPRADLWGHDRTAGSGKRLLYDAYASGDSRALWRRFHGVRHGDRHAVLSGSTPPPTAKGSPRATLISRRQPSVALHLGDLIQVGYQGYWLTLCIGSAVSR